MKRSQVIFSIIYFYKNLIFRSSHTNIFKKNICVMNAGNSFIEDGLHTDSEEIMFMGKGSLFNSVVAYDDIKHERWKIFLLNVEDFIS